MGPHALNKKEGFGNGTGVVWRRKRTTHGGRRT